VGDLKRPVFVSAAFVTHRQQAVPIGGASSCALFAPDMWWPPMDVYEAATKYVVLLEIGGVSEDGLKIEVDGQTVSIRGSRGDPSGHLEGELQCIHHREIDHGDFERHVFLPGPVDVTGVEATLSDGVLEVSLPKREPGSMGDARTIEVV